jgi:hypothetical protein
MKAVIVANRVTSYVFGCLVWRNVLASLSDNDHNLAFIIQPVTPLGPYDVTVMGIQSSNWFMKVSRGIRQLGHELVTSRPVIKVHRKDFGWLRRRQVNRFSDLYSSTIRG